MKICICTTPAGPYPTDYPPVGPMAIIQALRKIGEEASFRHIDYHRYSDNQNSEYFAKHQFDMVGISAIVSTAYLYTKNLTKIIKKVSPKTIVFVGGSLVASSKILHSKANVDYCVIGDGEIIVQNLVKAVREKKTSSEDLSKIIGLTYLDSNDKFTFTGFDHPLPASMIERPDYSILEKDNSIDHYIYECNPKNNYEKYNEMISGYPWVLAENYNENQKQGKKKATVVVAKGCVARCTFCHRNEKGYRVSPTDSIINHMKMLKEKYNVKYIHIGDENFGSYKNETIKLIKEMKSLGLLWVAAGVRAHTVDLETLKTWKENGCINVSFGIESGSPSMLKVMEKKISLEQNIIALKAAYEAGVAAIVQLVIGMPGETDETIDETIDFLVKTLPYYPDCFKKKVELQFGFNYALSLPGTPLYEYAREHGLIGNDIDSEEAYLLEINDAVIDDTSRFRNYTQQPLLKVLSWRSKISWKVFREHAKTNLNISLSKLSILQSLLIISINQIFKTKLNFPIKKTFDKLETDIKIGSYATPFNNYFYFQYALKLLLPWNKFTYPFIAVLIAFREARGLARYKRRALTLTSGNTSANIIKVSRKSTGWFFKLIFDHIYWSLNVFKKINLPKETLRKVVNILDKDTDTSLKLREGR